MKSLVRKNISGFTLIELLVVIAIISLLSSVVLSSLSGARANSRDARRLQDINQIRTALELYYNDNGQYPFPNESGFYASYNSSGVHKEWSILAAELQPYIEPLPVDPTNVWPLTYFYGTDTYSQCPSYDGGSYVLFVATETLSSDWRQYEIQGENGSAHRYCVYP